MTQLERSGLTYPLATANLDLINSDSGFYVVTPGFAQYLLTINKNNRPLKKAFLNQYVKQMAAGNFYRAQGQIKITSEPKLIQGQHTLHAVVRSGVDQILGIEFDADERIAPFLDSGATRSASDNLKMQGLEHSEILASGIKIFHNYRRYPSLIWNAGGKFKVWNDEIDAFADRYYESYLIFIARFIHEQYKLLPSLNQGAAFALFLIAAEAGISSSFVRQFFIEVASGAQDNGFPVPVGSATLAVRSYISGDTPRKLASAHRQQWHLHVYMKALNMFLKKEPCKRMKMTDLAPLPILDKSFYRQEFVYKFEIS